MKFFIRILCFIGIHWSGEKGIGMYGDANRCSHCGYDAYGTLVLKEDVNKKD
jgi:hypothetical protein